MAEDKTALNYI